MTGPPSARRSSRRNREADWDRWPVRDYLAENYRQLHPVDVAVIRHHSAFYRQFRPGRIGRSLELGAGPNLYPLMVASAASRRIEAVEPSAANLAYLSRQLAEGPDPSWQDFYALCRRLDPALPVTLREALDRVVVVPGSARTVRPDFYDLASMHFVAESVTEDFAEFAGLCGAFIRSVRPGGHLLAAFMENMPSYRIGSSPEWPACPIDASLVRSVFAPHTTALRIIRVGKDRTLPDYGDTGVVLLWAIRRDISVN
ncbi:class I SAM-dependent methyltransferase [Streptomyces sp. GESEQ-35]|uniref:class I SAM-dependent methyltransferase n=1 Tax=Streptomyces sp. GESEQ-35 TaxID=2812657 RepID=UPI001B31A73C|nr:class I SAM-dependent methyltransferase [Streptomyces sp. GESEQ-35]